MQTKLSLADVRLTANIATFIDESVGVLFYQQVIISTDLTKVSSPIRFNGVHTEGPSTSYLKEIEEQ